MYSLYSSCAARQISSWAAVSPKGRREYAGVIGPAFLGGTGVCINCGEARAPQFPPFARDLGFAENGRRTSQPDRFINLGADAGASYRDHEG